MSPIRSGIGARLFLDQYDLSGDVGSIGSIAANTNLQDTTVLRDVAVRRLALLRDGQMGFNAFYDPAVGGSQVVLQDLPGVATQVTVCTGSVVGYDTFSLRGLQATFGDTRGQDGSLALDTSIMANGTALEVGKLLTTALQTFATAAAGTSVTYAGTSTAFGLSAYLHAISIGSGSATVAVQDSADNSSFANVTGAVFTAVTAATKQRIATGATATVRKYVRVNVSGTFTNLAAVVTFIRYPGSPHP